MGPNDVDLARVFVRERGTIVGDDSIPAGRGVEIVVEAEAGSTIHGGGTQFLTSIVVRDLSANNNIPFTPPNYNGTMATTPAWPNFDRQFVFEVAPAALAGREDHLCEVLAFVKAGLVNPDVEFATSYTFILT
jgi:hypothetical protein